MPVPPDHLDRWAALVRDRCGLTFTGGRGRVLARVVGERARATGCRDEWAYYVRLAADPASGGRPGGYLFLGPADAVGLPTPGLTTVRIGDTWAYHRTTP